MTKEQLFEAIGEVEPTAAQKAPRLWLRWAALAACLLLMIGAVWLLLPRPEPPTTDAQSPAVGPPAIAVDGRRYTVSSYLAVSETLPEGYVYSGASEFGDYYVNPAVPEWIYVHCEIRTNGQVDEHNTLIPTEPHMAYLRYVDSRIRGDDYISVDGALYLSMWSAKDYGDDPDLTHEEYDAIVAKYGIRIEGAPPTSFVSAGTAEFTGYDTVPDIVLGCNTGTPEVLVSAADPDIILASTSWHTAPTAEGEVEHHGWNVYVRCK